MRGIWTAIAAAGLAAALCVASANPVEAAVIIISTSYNQLQPGIDNQGWVCEFLANGNETNSNYYTGLMNGSDEHRSYFFFDLSSVVDPVVSATLELRRYDSEPGSAIEFFDVSTPAAALIATRGGPANPGIFSDLGSGASYGSFLIGSGSSPDILSFSLKTVALGDINAASGYFAIGCRVTLGGPVFSSSNDEPGQGSIIPLNSTQQLVLVTSGTSVPESSTLLLLTIGIFALIGYTWRCGKA